MDNEKIRLAFIEAEAFLLASKHIIETNESIDHFNVTRDLYMSLAFEVNQSYATEIYLKCFHIAITGKHPRGHHLGNLFENLPNNIKSELNDHYEKVYSENEFRLFDFKKYSLTELINQTGSYFDLARYGFERDREIR